MSDIKAQEARVDQYVSENRTDEAVKLLLELILAHVEQKEFEKAEALRDKLYEVDPMALTEIVRAGDAIDEAKNQDLDPEHREVWSDLYDRLNLNEGNALYYGMKNVSFKTGEVIIEQGQISKRLFFINKGEVKAIFSGEKTTDIVDTRPSDILLKVLKEGDFFGNDQFFSATVSTYSLIAQSSVRVSCLESAITKKWKTEAPALESRLFDYCRKNDKIKIALEQKGMERREYERIKLPVKLLFQLLDVTGKKIEKYYKGEISDISEGGLSFFIKTSRAETVRILLGRRLFVSFQVRLKNGECCVVEKDGQVTAVQSQAFDDFSIHLKFDNPLERKQITSFAGE